MPAAAWLLLALLNAPQDLESKVAGQVRRLTSDDPAEREAAVGELAALGGAAVPHLERFAGSAQAEVRDGVARAIRAIRLADPLFLVRPPERRVTLTLNKAPAAEAYAGLFKEFPEAPDLGAAALHLLRERQVQVTIALRGARYWEAVKGFAEAAGVFPEAALQEIRFKTGSSAGYSLSDASGPFAVGASAGMEDNVPALELRLHAEPGWLVESSGVKVEAIDVMGGASVLEQFALGERGGSREFKAVFKAKNPWVRERVRLRVRGVAWVRTVARAEGVVVRAAGFSGKRDLKVGDYSVLLEGLISEGGSLSYQATVRDGRKAKAPADASFRDELWYLVADDSGMVRNPMRTVGAASAGLMTGLGSSGRVPTRLGLLRPLEVERVEVPFTIEGIPVN